MHELDDKKDTKSKKSVEEAKVSPKYSGDFVNPCENCKGCLKCEGNIVNKCAIAVFQK